MTLPKGGGDEVLRLRTASTTVAKRVDERDCPVTAMKAERVPSTLARRGDIQGLRFVAALAVVLFHGTSLMPNGFLGVDIFFVISGYIIADLTRAEIEATGTFSVSRFLKRRMLRVLPPTIVVVAFALVIGFLVDTPSRISESMPLISLAAISGTVNFYFLQQVTDYFQMSNGHPLLHMWSLSIELQFYVLFGVTVATGLYLIKRPHLAPHLVATLIAGLFVAFAFAAASFPRWQVGWIANPDEFAFFMLPSRLWEFGLGILASCLRVSFGRTISGPMLTNFMQISGAALLLTGLIHGSMVGNVQMLPAILPCVGAALLMMSGPLGIVARNLAWRPLTFLGDRSFSIYLWQGPLIAYAAMLAPTDSAIAIAALLSVVVAALTGGKIENLFRQQQECRSAKPWTSPNFFTFYVAALGAVLILMPIVPIAHGGFAAARPVRAVALDKACKRQRGDQIFAPCVYNKSGISKVLLVGDSHAGALSEATIEAAARADWQAHVATASGCALVEHEALFSYRRSCHGYSENVARYAQKERFELVVIQQYSKVYIEKIGIGLKEWQHGLATLVRRLAETGAFVVVMGDNLDLPRAVGRPLWAPSWYVSLYSGAKRRLEVEEAERSAFRSIPNTLYLPAREYLCKDFVCPIFTDGNWHYTDLDHLSQHGAKKLSAPLNELMMIVNPPKLSR